MKKILILACALAALSFISCSEKLVPELPEAGEYITVTTQVIPQSKAGYEGTSVLPSQFKITIDQEGTDKDYNDKTMVREGSTNKYKFQGNEQLKWASSDHGSVRIKAITTPGNYSNGVMTVNPIQSTEDAVLASDLLGAQTGEGIEINGSNVIVHFNHLMAKLYVKYNTSDVTVESLTINNICVSGEYNYDSMSYGQAGGTGSITMLHNSNDDTAEAIFFPYTPGSDPELSVKIQGKSQPMTTQISLAKVGGTFLPGKRYILNVTITDSRIDGAEVTVNDWAPDFSSVQVKGKKVLWIGTSIPQGNVVVNYPAMVDDAMNCTIMNNAVGGSLVLLESNGDWVLQTTKADWDTYVVESYEGIQYSFKHLQAGGLAQKHTEAESMYEANLKTIYLAAEPIEPSEPTKPGEEPVEPKREDYWSNSSYNRDHSQWETDHAQWVSRRDAYAAWETEHAAWEVAYAAWERGRTEWPAEQLEKIKSLSYESKILPHIDPARGGDYEVVIIDHGFNDVVKMAFEAGGHVTAYEYEPWGDVWGYRYLKDIESKIIDWEECRADFNSNPNLTVDGRTEYSASYVLAMSRVIDDIKKTNPNVKIIMGNYFALYSPWVRANHFPGFEENFSSLICYNNEALAGMWDLDIVNVYKYLDIPEDMFWNPAGYDLSKFCPDGVHPSNPAAVEAIAEIYIRELDGVIGSRGRDNTVANNASGASIDALGIDSWDEEIVL